MRRLVVRSIIVSICGLLLSLTLFAKPVFMDAIVPPPGFETVDMTQRLRLSVFFMEHFIGFYYVNLHAGQLTFVNPDQLLENLSGVSKKRVLLKRLNQAFALNIECTTNHFAQLPQYCEQLKQKPLYLTYQPKQETVHLYLASNYFKNLTVHKRFDYIDNSSAGWSYLNRIGAAGSFNNQANPLTRSLIYPSLPNYYNFYTNNTVAHGNDSVVSNISQNNGINNGQHFQIQSLYAQHIYQDKNYVAGYVTNPSSAFFQTEIIAGAGVKTTLETLRDADTIAATPLVIFVPEASQISIFKQDQLIFSQYLEAGYQRINTQGFPEGGYELTVDVGHNTIQRRFFSKGWLLPPIEAPQFYVVGGYLTNEMILTNSSYNALPKVFNIPVIQTGFNQRVTEQLALSSQVLWTGHQGLVELGSTFFLNQSLIKAAALITTKNDYGWYTMVNFQQKKININLIATRLWYSNRVPYYFFLNNLIDNDSISASYQLSAHQLLGIQGNYTRSLAQPKTYSGGAFYQQEIGAYRHTSFFFNAAYNKSIYVGHTYNLSLSMNFTQERLTGTEAVLMQHQSNHFANDTIASPLVIQGSSVYSHQDEQGMGNAFNEIHTLSPTVTSLAATYDYANRQGFSALYANYNKIKHEKYSLGYGGNIETALVVNQDGLSVNGTSRSSNAGIVIRVDAITAADTSAQFALIDSNNRKIARFSANKSVFVALPVFTDDNFTLVNLSKNDYFINEPTRHIILYPGNVGYYLWHAEKRVVVIGQMIDSHRKPLADVWVHAANNGIFTDHEGNFQLELASDTKRLNAAERCQITLPSLNTDKAYVFIGEVVCGQ